MLTQKPIIISVGCSFTDRAFKSRVESLPDEKRGGWPIWTDHFKNKLQNHYNKKYQIIHYGKSGGSNDFAFEHIIKNFAKHKDRIKFILWGGTEFKRFYHPFSGFNHNPNADMRGYPNFLKMKSEDYWRNNYQQQQLTNVMNMINFGGQIDSRLRVIDHNLKLYWTVLMLCQQYNATLLLNQLLDPMHPVGSMSYEYRRILGKEDKILPINYKCDREYEIRRVMHNPYFKDLYKHRKHFFNLRFVHIKDEVKTGVNHWTAYVDLNHHHEKYLIKPWNPDTDRNMKERDQFGAPKEADTHPNAAGHENIANQLWKHYETNFL